MKEDTQEKTKPLTAVVLQRRVRAWRKCRPGMLRTVDFPLGVAIVKLLSSFNYHDGRVYHVEDIATGHRDFVGIEYLRP